MLLWLVVVLVAALGVGVLSLLLFLLGAHARFVAYHRFKGSDVPYPAGMALVGYLAAELYAMLRISWWHVRARLPTFRRVAGDDPTPVVLIHGYSQNATNMWGMRVALEACGRVTFPVSLGLPFRSIDGYCPRLVAGVERALRATGATRFDLVAHSMGGIVTRRVLAQRPDLARRLRRVVTLGSPHLGTAGARGLVFVREAQEMRRRSDLLGSLPTFRDLAPDAEVTTIAARQDYVVYPSDTCHLPGARAITLDRVGHAGLIAHPAAVRAVTTALCAPPEG